MSGRVQPPKFGGMHGAFLQLPIAAAQSWDVDVDIWRIRQGGMIYCCLSTERQVWLLVVALWLCFWGGDRPVGCKQFGLSFATYRMGGERCPTIIHQAAGVFVFNECLLASNVCCSILELHRELSGGCCLILLHCM